MGRRNNHFDSGGKKFAGILTNNYLGNDLFNKFVNMVMLDGKKNDATKYVSYALRSLAAEFFPEEEDESDAMLKVLMGALENVQSDTEVRPRRFGGTTYQIPVNLKEKRKIYLAFKWIITSARDRSTNDIPKNDIGNNYVGKKGIAVKLLIELRNAFKGVGGAGSAIEKSKNVKDLAEKNKHFSHFKF